MARAQTLFPGEQHGEEHHIPIETHFKIFAALIGFTLLTVVTAKMMDFGAFDALIAFSIATVKAFLVMAYFMHLKYDGIMNRAIIASSFFFVFLLFLFCVLDIYSRITQVSTL